MKRGLASLLVLMALTALTASAPLRLPAQADNPAPPDHVVKLIFIHHSTGENWLEDDYGGLGLALSANNYFVSDTNYGWGPDGIGDRTDIPDWEEWFSSGDTPRYMQALFNESGQNSWYTRTLADPGGENTIVLFKSCFPNSDLEGGPNDPPGTYGDLTVSGAKYVYNQILQYFATRPDKLFIVITAPPLSSPSEPANARAFNDWLVNDWLAENDYPYPNVAVFDFYNVLTHPDAHHWFHDGEVQHITTSRNTLYYPSDDDHPSVAGSRKATEEFVPLLNIYYNRWAGTAPAQLPSGGEAPSVPTAQEAPAAGVLAGMVADFETLSPSLAAYWDESTPTRLSCERSSDATYNGDWALKIDFDIAPGAWSTCMLSYDDGQDWSAGAGLWFALHASQAGLPYEIILYSGTPDETESYITYADTTTDGVSGWATVEIPWEEFRRVDWEEGAGSPFASPERIFAMAFGFSGEASSANRGTVWVDDIQLLGLEAIEAEQPEGEEEAPGRPALCGGAALLPLTMVGFVLWRRRRSEFKG
jgi:hypothetical protein